VTFRDQRTAMIALNTRCTADADEFVMSVPPQPSDIIYDDLKTNVLEKAVLQCVGAACILLLFWSYLPFVVILSSMTNLNALERHFDIVRHFIQTYPGCHAMLDGVLSTLALVIFMSFLPTALMLIFHKFYKLKAQAWGQLKLQKWYFGFLAVYILMITAIGSSIVGRIKRIYDHPAAAFTILADAMPTATNFYLEYMLVQWVTHGMNLTRYIQALKYFSLKHVLSEDRAIELAEPEDQDFYGIGARSARGALDLVIAIVFSSLCPLILLITVLNFVITRVAYSYLMVFAETRKHDLGGPFYVQQLWHVQFGVLLYTILMTGVCIRRANHWGPVWIAFTAVLFVVFCMRRFKHSFQWEDLPFADVCTEEAIEGAEGRLRPYRAQKHRLEYKQPELDEDFWTTAGEA